MFLLVDLKHFSSSDERKLFEYVRAGFQDSETGQVCLSPGWQLEAIFRAFLYHTWGNPWGRLIYQYSSPAIPKNALLDTTPSPIPYFLLPCECIHCQKPFLKRGEYQATRQRPKLRCLECSEKYSEIYNIVLTNVNRAKQRFSNQREPVSRTEMFGELMAAYGKLWEYIQKPYTPRYMQLDPFHRVEPDWLFDFYSSQNFDLKKVGADRGIPLFPDDRIGLIQADDYYSKKHNNSLDNKRNALIARKIYEIDGFFAPWELSLELLDFQVTPELSAHI